ncbi:MAG: beta-galactosidase [Burkholderiaceae bacterium]|nr:beta-galactosidase [Burkholderiaceae bacterium]
MIDPTRRHLLAFVPALGLAACGGGAPAPAPAPAPPPPPAAAAASRPRGLFVLGSTEVANEIAAMDFIDGVAVRLGWKETNPAAGQYDFAGVDAVLAALQAGGKKMNLEVFAVEVPAWLLAQVPAAEQWDAHAPGGSTVRTALPWNSLARQAWRDYLRALADHLVPLPSGALVRFAEHPTLLMLDAPIVGLQGVRDLTNTLTTLPGYTRAVFIDATLHSVHSSRDAFASKFGFLAFFKMNDSDRSTALDQQLMDRLMLDFNQPGLPPQLGFFQENLSDAGPAVSGLGALLASAMDRTFIAFQALTAWVAPFTGENNVTSGRAAVGIEFAYRTYGTTYVEIYLADVRDAKQTEGLRLWHGVLNGTASPPP